jgi:hypothetical protein
VDAAKFYLKSRWERGYDTEFAGFYCGRTRQSMVDQASSFTFHNVSAVVDSIRIYELLASLLAIRQGIPPFDWEDRLWEI